jgi:hypothetical protein
MDTERGWAVERAEQLKQEQNHAFEAAAESAERLAALAERSAEIHDRLPESVEGVREHAARDRRLAAAEREASDAFRRHELPADAIRQVIADP